MTLKLVSSWDLWPDLNYRPRLVLDFGERPHILKPAPTPDEYTIPSSSREWLYVEHQAGGVLCSHPRFLCTTLTPTPPSLIGMHELTKLWYGRNIMLTTSLEVVNQYQKNLQDLLGVDCNWSYPALQEGVYPIDAECLPMLTAETFPTNLDDLFKMDDADRYLGCLNRWRLLIISENSD